jgi:hypothetical protein
MLSKMLREQIMHIRSATRNAPPTPAVSYLYTMKGHANNVAVDVTFTTTKLDGDSRPKKMRVLSDLELFVNSDKYFKEDVDRVVPKNIIAMLQTSTIDGRNFKGVFKDESMNITLWEEEFQRNHVWVERKGQTGLNKYTYYDPAFSRWDDPCNLLSLMELHSSLPSLNERPTSIYFASHIAVQGFSPDAKNMMCSLHYYSQNEHFKHTFVMKMVPFLHYFDTSHTTAEVNVRRINEDIADRIAAIQDLTADLINRKVIRDESHFILHESYRQVTRNDEGDADKPQTYAQAAGSRS